jgi:HK97 gp10 family phage protein
LETLRSDFVSAEISITITGAEELAENLQSYFIETLQEKVSSAISNVGNEMLQTAQAIVPVRTGYLRSSIAFLQLSPWQFQLVARASYAAYVEFGTMRMAAEPYMTPAFQQHQVEMAQAISDAINSTIDGFYAL